MALRLVEVPLRFSVAPRYRVLTLSFGSTSASVARLYPTSLTRPKSVLLSAVSQLGDSFDAARSAVFTDYWFGVWSSSKRPPRVLLSLTVPRLLAIATLLTTNAVSKSLFGGNLKAKKVALAPLERALRALYSARAPLFLLSSRPSFCVRPTPL